jgi:cytoskeletal protein RodZ
VTTSFDLPRVRALVSWAVPRSRSDAVPPAPELVAKSPRSAEPVAAPELPVGATFMQERVRRGLTLADCESHLHIRAKFLAAIENDCDEDLPESAYARIFARSYASYLELDPVALARELDRRTGDTGWRDHATVDAAPRDAGHLDALGVLAAAWCRSPRVRTGRIAVAIALALSVLIWLGYRAESGPAPAVPPPATLGPVNISPSSPVPAASTRRAVVRPTKRVSTRAR